MFQKFSVYAHNELSSMAFEVLLHWAGDPLARVPGLIQPDQVSLRLIWSAQHLLLWHGLSAVLCPVGFQDMFVAMMQEGLCPAVFQDISVAMMQYWSTLDKQIT